ncbi:MAG: hypothetical protein NTW49_03800 [Bacteroidia bacterium]|nr:hypothetical protein [Bacteroidia bacterium]
MFELKQQKATRFGFGEGLRELGFRNHGVVAPVTDITSSVCLNLFKEAFPGIFFSRPSF